MAARLAYPDRHPLLISVPESPCEPDPVGMHAKPDQEFFDQLLETNP